MVYWQNVKHAKKKDKDTKAVDYCACWILANQPDFQEQWGLIQEEIEKRGHKGAMKAYARQKCDYTWTGLCRTVPEALDSIPVKHIHAYARLSF
ncbi:3670_t:CDS:2, partial [Cetraspora pellucida]